MFPLKKQCFFIVQQAKRTTKTCFWFGCKQNTTKPCVFHWVAAVAAGSGGSCGAAGHACGPGRTTRTTATTATATLY